MILQRPFIQAATAPLTAWLKPRVPAALSKRGDIPASGQLCRVGVMFKKQAGRGIILMDRQALDALYTRFPAKPEGAALADALLDCGGIFTDAINAKGAIIPAIRTFYPDGKTHITWHFKDGFEDAPDEKTPSFELLEHDGRILHTRNVKNTLMTNVVVKPL